MPDSGEGQDRRDIRGINLALGEKRDGALMIGCARVGVNRLVQRRARAGKRQQENQANQQNCCGTL